MAAWLLRVTLLIWCRSKTELQVQRFPALMIVCWGQELPALASSLPGTYALGLVCPRQAPAGTVWLQQPRWDLVCDRPCSFGQQGDCRQPRRSPSSTISATYPLGAFLIIVPIFCNITKVRENVYQDPTASAPTRFVVGTTVEQGLRTRTSLHLQCPTARPPGL